jgi:hypothetical protein
VQNGQEAPSGHEVAAPEAAGGGSALIVSAAAAEGSTGAEGEHSPKWQRQPKHVFVLTSAGKGPFARSGKVASLGYVQCFWRVRIGCWLLLMAAFRSAGRQAVANVSMLLLVSLSRFLTVTVGS